VNREKIIHDPRAVGSVGISADLSGRGEEKAAIWRQVCEPGTPEHLVSAMRAVLRHPSLPSVKRVLGDLDRFQASNAGLLGEIAGLFVDIREFKFALRLCQRAFVLRPEATGFAIYRIAWKCLMQAGNIAQSMRLAKRWIIVDGQDIAYQALCDSAARVGDPGVFVGSLETAMGGGLHPLGWQVRVSQLSRILTRARDAEGPTRTARLSGRVVGASGFHNQFQELLESQPEFRRELKSIASVVPESSLRKGLESLADGRTGDAISAYEAFARTGQSLPAPMFDLVEDGKFQGHPYWHLANPYFLIWSCGSTPSDSQQAWRTDRAVIKGMDPETTLRGYRDWLERENAARPHFARLVAGLGQKTVRVLDVGCGNGEWLRYLADKVGVGIENLMGMDLHESRVVATRAQLVEAATLGAACEGDPASVVRSNIQRQNLLDLGQDAYSRFGKIDVLALFVVTGCFDDAQLDDVLGRLAGLAPRFIFSTTVTRHWDMWHGRQDEEAFFLRHGYREVERHLLPETLTEDPFATLLLPRRYWTNHSARIYRRV
jgi:SAM-dependent methyltransferase